MSLLSMWCRINRVRVAWRQYNNICIPRNPSFIIAPTATMLPNRLKLQTPICVNQLPAKLSPDIIKR